MVVTIRSYPELSRAIAKREGFSKTQYWSKKRRLDYARKMGWSYRPPANFGVNQQVTMFESSGKQPIREEGKIVGTLSRPEKKYEERVAEARYKRQKQQNIKIAQEQIKRDWEAKTGTKYTGSPQQLRYYKKNIATVQKGQAIPFKRIDPLTRVAVPSIAYLEEAKPQKTELKYNEAATRRLNLAEQRLYKQYNIKSNLKEQRLIEKLDPILYLSKVMGKPKVITGSIALGLADAGLMAIAFGKGGIDITKEAFNILKEPKGEKAINLKYKIKSTDYKKLLKGIPSGVGKIVKSEGQLYIQNPIRYVTSLIVLGEFFKAGEGAVKLTTKGIVATTEAGAKVIKTGGKYLNKLGKEIKFTGRFKVTKKGKVTLKYEFKAKGKKKITKIKRLDITKLEKERIRLRLEAKKSRKLAKGLQIKAQRPIKVIRNGKPVYPFTNIKNGKITYFTSRKKWLRSVKQQERFLSSKAGKKFIRQKEISKKAPTVKKLEKERIRLRLEAKKSRKLAKGLQIKANRIGTAIRNGKKVYFFKDNITGKERYFSNRKKWLSAIKQQLKNEAKYSNAIKLYDLDTFFNNPFMITKQIILKPSKQTKKINEFLKKQKPTSKEITTPKGTETKAGKGQVQVLLTEQETKVKIKTTQKEVQKIKTLQKQELVLKQKIKVIQKTGKRIKLIPAIRTRLKQKQKQIQRLKQKVSQSLKQLQNVKQKQAQKQVQKQIQKLKEAVKLIQRQKQTQKLKQKLNQKLKQKQAQKQKLNQKLKQKTKTKTKQKTKKKKIKELEDKKKKIAEQYLKVAGKYRKGIYLSDLAANLLDEKASKTQRKRLLDPKRVFTGFERRLIV